MYEQLRSEDFEKALNEDANALLIDVRTESEYEQGHLPGSLNIDIMGAGFEDYIKTLDKNKHFFMYCRSGARSANACVALKHIGVQSRIVNLEGGILDWRGPVEV